MANEIAAQTIQNMNMLSPYGGIGHGDLAILDQFGLKYGRDYGMANDSQNSIQPLSRSGFMEKNDTIFLLPSGYEILSRIANDSAKKSDEALRAAGTLQKAAAVATSQPKHDEAVKNSDLAMRLHRDYGNTANGLFDLLSQQPGGLGVTGTELLIYVPILLTVLYYSGVPGISQTFDFIKGQAADKDSVGSGFFTTLQYALYGALIYGVWQLYKLRISPTIEGFQAGRASFKAAYRDGRREIKGKKRRKKKGKKSKKRKSIGSRLMDLLPTAKKKKKKKKSYKKGVGFLPDSVEDQRSSDRARKLTSAVPKKIGKKTKQKLRNMYDVAVSTIRNSPKAGGGFHTIKSWKKARGKGGGGAWKTAFSKRYTDQRKLIKDWTYADEMPPLITMSDNKKDGFKMLWLLLTGDHYDADSGVFKNFPEE